MKRAAILVVASLVMVEPAGMSGPLGPAPALAAAQPTEREPQVGVAPAPPDQLLIDGEVSSGSAGHGESSTPRPTHQAPGHARTHNSPPNPAVVPDALLDPQLRPDPSGTGYCLYIGRRAGVPNSSEADMMAAKTMRLVQHYRECATSPGTPKQVSPGAAAARAWHDLVTLPRPTVWMAPGKTITGLEGCLEIGGPPTVSADYPDVLGVRVHIDAVSDYVVDWGDGTTTTTSDRGGSCEAGGKLRHAYQYKGDKTITVTQRWTAAWTGGGSGGEIADVLHTVGTLRLPVIEIQPVIVDPATAEQ